ncbi:MAG: hypothetical protein ACK4PR_01305 [Gammaproteobacteria bacterium]
MNNVPFTFGRNAITLYLDGITYNVPASSPNFNDVKNALKNGADEAHFKQILNIRSYITALSEGRAEVSSDGLLYWNGKQLNSTIAQRVSAMFHEGLGVSPLLKFLNKVFTNPRLDKNNYIYSPSFEDELYLFLESGDCPITEDGNFLAYKMIRSDYRDIYTGSMDNSPGVTVRLGTWANVDPNRYNTCSNGLHFASLEYVLNGNYGSWDRGHRLVVVEVDPADVIAIPNDYNNSKGRAWRYKILREIEWSDRIRPNFITNNHIDNWNEPEWDDSYDDCLSECKSGDDSELEIVSKPVQSGSLSDDEVRQIRRHLGRGDSLAAIARFYDVSARTIARIRDRETYNHVV